MHPIIKFHKYHAALIESYIWYLAQKDKKVYFHPFKNEHNRIFPVFWLH